MSQTIEHRALEKVRHQTTRKLYAEIKGPDSFALAQAVRLPSEARQAAISLADSPYPINTEAEVASGLLSLGYRASAFAEFLPGIAAYAASRRSTSP
jgi:hypothetical protein